jgi:hypothetical protein
VPPYAVILVSVTLLLLFGEILPSAVFTVGSEPVVNVTST